jgi:hypothetical protein
MVRPMIQPATMARMQARDERAMPDTCLIKRNIASPVNGAPGKPNFQPVAPGTPVICRVVGAYATPSTQEQEVALQLQGIQVETLVVPLGTDLLPNDQVTISGEIFTVIGTDKVTSYLTGIRALIKAVGVVT